jgi:coenzyme F420-reducing hydrogenase alpha subunit
LEIDDTTEKTRKKKEIHQYEMGVWRKETTRAVAYHHLGILFQEGRASHTGLIAPLNQNGQGERATSWVGLRTRDEGVNFPNRHASTKF